MIDLSEDATVPSVAEKGGGRKASKDQFPTHEEVSFNRDVQESYISKTALLQNEKEKAKVLERKLRDLHTDMQDLPSPQIERRRIPPPKPPRTDLMETEGASEERTNIAAIVDRAKKVKEESGEVKEEIKKVVRRVSSIVDMNDQELTRVAKSTTPVRHGPAPPIKPRPRGATSAPQSSSGSPIPKPRLIRKRSKSSDGILRPSITSITKAYSNDSRMMRHPRAQQKQRPKVSRLIQMFETKSPEVKQEKGPTFKWTPPSPRRRSNALSEVSSGESAENSPSHARPNLPPKPQYPAPPIPPRPLSCTGEEGPPVVPPRTPAPLVPPKPPGSKAPKVIPRVPRQRSHSDSDSKILNEDIPPRVPPKLVTLHAHIYTIKIITPHDS